MKRYYRLLWIAIGATSIATALKAREVTSRSFFSARPRFQSASPERVSLFRNNLMDECPEGCGFGGAFQAVLYAGRTTRGDGSRKLAEFFLPSTQQPGCINVKEFDEFELTADFPPQDSADYSPVKNVEARHLNIVTNLGVNDAIPGSFSSRACFAATRSFFGIGFVAKQRLSCKDDGSTGWWGEFSLPVERVRTDITIREQIENNGQGADLSAPGLDESPHVDSVKAAFAQTNWKFGRIVGPKTKWGVADVEVKLGYNTVTTPCSMINSYVGFVAPTGTRVESKTVFEPILGNNKHFGIMGGYGAYFSLWTIQDWNITWWIDLNSRFLFKNTQVRSFDLVGKQWSRYMEVYDSREQAVLANNSLTAESTFIGTSGINVFTQRVHVEPHAQVILNTAFQGARAHPSWTFVGELGFNLWARQAETLELACCEGLPNIALKATVGDGETTLARNIKQNFVNSTITLAQEYIELSKEDIDLQSAAHPAVITHTAYLVLGFKTCGACPCFGGVGAGYEFQHKELNSGLEQWIIWAKAGFTY